MICANINRIKKNIEEAAVRSGRDPEEITLLAVSKRMGVEKIREAVRCGQTCFGENFVQEARDKIEALGGSLSWHFIGHLQSNKARLAAQLFTMVETVDRMKIARALNRHAREMDKQLDVLIQVNIGRERQKSGILPEQCEEFVRELEPLTSLRVRGLMTMPPNSPDPETTRPFFRTLNEMAQLYSRKGFFAENEPVVVSMGMSSDYTVAIEEGATLVRVGTSIFGKRT